MLSETQTLAEDPAVSWCVLSFLFQASSHTKKQRWSSANGLRSRTIDWASRRRPKTLHPTFLRVLHTTDTRNTFAREHVVLSAAWSSVLAGSDYTLKHPLWGRTPFSPQEKHFFTALPSSPQNNRQQCWPITQIHGQCHCGLWQ